MKALLIIALVVGLIVAGNALPSNLSWLILVPLGIALVARLATSPLLRQAREVIADTRPEK